MRNAGGERGPPAKRGTVRLACHPDEEEIYLVTQGKGAVELNGTAYPVRPGQVIYVPRNYTHRARNTADEPFEYVCVANWPTGRKAWRLE